MVYLCCVCQRVELPAGKYWVCETCKDAYGLRGSWLHWPDWARECYNSEHRKRMQDERAQWDVNADLDCDDGWRPEPIPILRTRHDQDIYGLPLGPYRDEAQNRDYRAAHGL